LTIGTVSLLATFTPSPEVHMSTNQCTNQSENTQLSFAATISTAGFSTLPNHILLNPTISPDAKLAYAVLRYYSRTDNGCFAKRETLSHYSNLSLFRLRNALNELKDLGLISIKNRGQGLPDLIHVLDKPTPDLPKPDLQPEPDLPSEPMLTDEICCPDAPDGDEIANPDMEKFDISVEHLEEDYINNNPIDHSLPRPGTSHESQSQEREREIINYFFQIKENRSACETELRHWRNTARMLLTEFSVEEVKEAIRRFADEARLFYYIGLKAPGYIHQERRRKEEVEKLPVPASKPPEEPMPENRVHQMPSTARTAHDETQFRSEAVRLLEAIRERVRPQSFHYWLENINIQDIGDDFIVFRVPTVENALVLEKEYLPLLQELTGKNDIRILLSP